MNDSDIIDIILNKNIIEIIKSLPRTKRTAKSIWKLSKLCGIPQTTMYRSVNILLKWDNIGQVLIPDGKGHQQLRLYLKQHFKIIFETDILRVELTDD